MGRFYSVQLAPTAYTAATDPFTLTMSAPADSTTVGGCMIIEEL